MSAPIACILFAHKGNIVFHRAGSHTSLTARAEILVDDHAPTPTRFFFST